MRVLLVPVGDDTYALPLDRVDGVLEPRPLTRLPEAPRSVLGLVNVRGRVVAVLDPARLLGLGTTDDVAALAVVRTARGIAALAAAGVPAAADLGEDLGPSRLDAGLRRHRVGDGVATLLDLDALLAPTRIAA